MIITKLQGGLGNQMFQYAIGKHLAVKHNTELKIDISYYKEQVLRRYELDGFGITDEVISAEALQGLLSPSRLLLVRAFKRFILFDPPYLIAAEKNFSFDPQVLLASENTYLTGNWQSEKYFRSIGPVIRKCFLFKNSSPENLSVSEKIANTNAISIHIRRGDFVSNERTNRYHGICDMDYYGQAISNLSEKVTDSVFYVFSDDISWAKENFKIPYAHHYVDARRGHDHEDMRLMSLCKHQIIANSSFSWWAAWLNSNPDKIVVAPKKWFADKSMNDLTNDLIPETWTRI